MLLNAGSSRQFPVLVGRHVLEQFYLPAFCRQMQFFLVTHITIQACSYLDFVRTAPARIAPFALGADPQRNRLTLSDQT